MFSDYLFYYAYFSCFLNMHQGENINLFYLDEQSCFSLSNLCYTGMLCQHKRKLPAKLIIILWKVRKHSQLRGVGMGVDEDWSQPC